MMMMPDQTNKTREREREREREKREREKWRHPIRMIFHDENQGPDRYKAHSTNEITGITCIELCLMSAS